MSLQLEKLRCTNCGAPLTQPKPGENFIKCDYCGFLNKITDTTAYIERLKNEIMKWLSQVLPQQSIITTTADPVARHHIFQAYIKPNLIVVNTNAKTAFIQSIHKPLIVFNPVYVLECSDPKSLFERSILVDGIADLAVSDEDKIFLHDTKKNLLVPAYVCNAIKDALEEKYNETIKNIDEAIALVENSDDRALLARLRIAKTVYTALRELYERNPIVAYNLLTDAEKLLDELLNKRNDPGVVKYLPALEIEKDLVKLTQGITEMSKSFFEHGEDPLKPLAFMKKITGYIVDNVRKYNRPFKDVIDIVELDKRTFLARLGKQRVKVLGDGDIFIPFYVVGVNITYTSGILFKKGQETKIDLLISAASPVHSSLTDIFNTYSGKPISIEKDQDMIKSVSMVLGSMREDYLRKKTVPPLISSSIADIIADRYLDAARSRYAGKIKLSTTQVRDLVYIGVSYEGGFVRSPVSLAIFSSDLNKLNDLLI